MSRPQGVPRRHAHRKFSSAPPCVDRKSSQTFAVFVTLPSGAVCSIRNVPRPGDVEWINCQLELQTGIDAQLFSLHFPDGSNLTGEQSLPQPSPQIALILKLHLIDSFRDVFRAIISNDWNQLKSLLAPSVEINNFVAKEEGSPLKTTDTNISSHDLTFCSLFLASSIGLEDLCRLVIETDPDVVNKTTDLGHTAVHSAVCNDQSAIVELLLGNGANPTVTDMLGRTSLQIALSKGAKQCVKILRFFKFQLRPKDPTTTEECVKEISSTGHGSSTVTFQEGDEDGINREQIHNKTSRRMSSLVFLQKARVKFRDSIVSKESPEGSIIDDSINNESHQGSSIGSSAGQAYFQSIARGVSVDEHKMNVINSELRIAEGSRFRPLLQNRPNSASVTYGHLPKTVEFLIANRHDLLWDLQGPSSTPRSTTSSGNDDLSSDERCASSAGSRVSGPLDKIRASSAGSYSSRNSRRSSPKQAPRTKWLSVKRKLRLAYIFKKALETKTGQNDTAYRQWLDKKERGLQILKRNKLKKCKSGNAEANEQAFNEWLHAKNNQTKNERVFRGMYKSAFIIGSTKGGEPKYPDIMENKDSYKKWLQTYRSPHPDFPDVVTSKDLIKSDSYKNMVAQKQKMLTSAVTYEEWLDAKYIQEQFYKELQALTIREKQKEVTETLVSKSFHQSSYDKWTRRGQDNRRKVHFSSGDKNITKRAKTPSYQPKRNFLPQ